jgi:hypothetical protein
MIRTFVTFAARTEKGTACVHFSRSHGGGNYEECNGSENAGECFRGSRASGCLARR